MKNQQEGYKRKYSLYYLVLSILMTVVTFIAIASSNRDIVDKAAGVYGALSFILLIIYSLFSQIRLSTYLRQYHSSIWKRLGSRYVYLRRNEIMFFAFLFSREDDKNDLILETLKVEVLMTIAFFVFTLIGTICLLVYCQNLYGHLG